MTDAQKMRGLADEIDAAFERFLNTRNTATLVIEEKALTQVLWDNKAGIVAALRTASNQLTAGTGVREALEAVRDNLAEAMHTAFRKASDHAEANTIWHAIKRLPPAEWASIVQFMLDGMGVTAALTAPAVSVDVRAVTDEMVEAACRARHSPQAWGRSLAKDSMQAWIHSHREEMRKILTAAFSALPPAQETKR
jgi:hypothetical protein